MSRSIVDDIERQIAAAGVPGVAVALLIDGAPALERGIGHRDLARTSPLDAGARFYAYSVTKVMLAAALLRLVDRAALDAPMGDLIPDLPYDLPVTLRQVLNHTAGLPDYGALPAYKADLRADPATPWTDVDFLDRTLPRGLLFPPGEGWAYSNIGYLLVRLIVERLAGTPLREALADLVIGPLGLQQTTVAASLDDTQLLTPGYSAELDADGALHDISRRYHPGWVSHGVVIATALDLARMLDGILAGDALGPALPMAMLGPVDVPFPHPLFARPAYGLGLMIDRASPLGLVAGHGGGGPGYAAGALSVTGAVGHRVTAVALANRDHGEIALETAFALLRHGAELATRC
jgi:D-alanyl-D-alanine carboxypeptidase